MDTELTEEKRKAAELTPAAEDYLKMIFRMSFDDCQNGAGKPVRICALAESLHVSPSSASRMAQSMALWGYLDFRRYGFIMMTDLGREHGEYLVRRHDTVEKFFCRLCGGETDVDIEKIEHYVTKGATEAMEKSMAPCDDNSEEKS